MFNNKEVPPRMLDCFQHLERLYEKGSQLERWIGKLYLLKMSNIISSNDMLLVSK